MGKKSRRGGGGGGGEGEGAGRRKETPDPTVRQPPRGVRRGTPRLGGELPDAHEDALQLVRPDALRAPHLAADGLQKHVVHCRPGCPRAFIRTMFFGFVSSTGTISTACV
jgi:hypothetical protein